MEVALNHPGTPVAVIMNARILDRRVTAFLISAWACTALAQESPLRSLQVELPNQWNNAIQLSWPGIGCWFWGEDKFKPEGYQRFLDLQFKHSAYRLLTTSTRAPHQITEPHTHDQVKQATIYARDRDLWMPKTSSPA
jgi:hypothetical protein